MKGRMVERERVKEEEIGRGERVRYVYTIP